MVNLLGSNPGRKLLEAIIISIFLGLSFPTWSSAGEGDFSWPETIAARVASQYLEAHNSADPEAYQQYIQAWRSSEWLADQPLLARREMFLGISNYAGVIEVAAGRTLGERRIELVGFADGMESWVRLVFELSEGPDPHIIRFEMLPSGPPEIVFADMLIRFSSGTTTSCVLVAS